MEQSVFSPRRAGLALWTLALWTLALIAGCKTAPIQAASQADAAAVRVQTTRAHRRESPLIRTFFGSLTAEQQASVTALVSGRIERRFIERGDHVRAGDPLFRLRDGDYRDQSAQAAAALGQALVRSGTESPEVRAAQAQLNTVEESLHRTELLATQGSASAQDLTRARAELVQARTQLTLAQQGVRAARFATTQARAQLSASQRAVRETLVRAPFEGDVIERRVDVGDFAPAGVVIATILRRDSMRVRFDAGQADSFVLRAGQTARVIVEGLEAAPMTATLRFISPSSSESARAVTVEATLAEADPRVRPGQFATVHVVLDQTQTRVAVDRRAVRTVAGVSRVFVVREGRVEERVVSIPDEPERADTPELLVARGVTDGEMLVLDPSNTLADGATVTP
ncbi:MAG: efflux RND transporter periplasmic adaptor subunit [Deltaproteobacteria bacterium]|nr:efflux RND transporter periplasmic adaptor subunit [Deltaproteobacteria bacterium]